MKEDQFFVMAVAANQYIKEHARQHPGAKLHELAVLFADQKARIFSAEPAPYTGNVCVIPWDQAVAVVESVYPEHLHLFQAVPVSGRSMVIRDVDGCVSCYEIISPDFMRSQRSFTHAEQEAIRRVLRSLDPAVFAKDPNIHLILDGSHDVSFLFVVGILSSGIISPSALLGPQTSVVVQ